jgi:hypothetical protein
MAKIQIASIYEYFKGGNYIVLGKTETGDIAIIHEDYKNKDTVLIRKEKDFTEVSQYSKKLIYSFVGTAKDTHKELFLEFLNKEFFYGIKMDGTGVNKLKLNKGTYMTILE